MVSESLVSLRASYATSLNPSPDSDAMQIKFLSNVSSPRLFGRKSTLRPQPLTEKVQRIDARTATNSQARQKRDALIHAQIVKHGVAEVDTARRKRAPREVVACKQTRSVLRVAKRQVQEYALDDEEDTNRGNHDTDAGHDPVYVLAARPAEDEQPSRHEEGDEQRGDEAALRRAEPMGDDVGVYAGVDVPPVPRDREDDADCDREERQTHFAEVEAVDVNVDEREGFEERVKDAVAVSVVSLCLKSERKRNLHDSGVYSSESDAGIEEHQLEGSPKRFGCDGGGGQIGLVDLGLRLEIGIAGELA